MGLRRQLLSFATKSGETNGRYMNAREKGSLGLLCMFSIVPGLATVGLKFGASTDASASTSSLASSSALSDIPWKDTG